MIPPYPLLGDKDDDDDDDADDKMQPSGMTGGEGGRQESQEHNEVDHGDFEMVVSLVQSTSVLSMVLNVPYRALHRTVNVGVVCSPSPWCWRRRRT